MYVKRLKNSGMSTFENAAKLFPDDCMYSYLEATIDHFLLWYILITHRETAN